MYQRSRRPRPVAGAVRIEVLNVVYDISPNRRNERLQAGDLHDIAFVGQVSDLPISSPSTVFQPLPHRERSLLTAPLDLFQHLIDLPSRQRMFRCPAHSLELPFRLMNGLARARLARCSPHPLSYRYTFTASTPANFV